MKKKELATLFVGKSEAEQLDAMEELLCEMGFKETEVVGKVRNGECCKTTFYSKEGADNIFAMTVNRKGVYLPVIMPSAFAEKFYMKNGKFDKIIRLKSHSNNDGKFSPAIDYCGKRNVYLHRIMLKEAGFDIEKSEVDHIGGHHGIILLVELRPSNSVQNKLNKVNAKNTSDSEFAYNKYHDFRNSFWIPFLHYVLGVISAEDMHTFREIELSRV